jgi:hypothetical protein
MNVSEQYNIVFEDETGFISRNIEALNVSDELKHILQQHKANGNLEGLFLRTVGRTRTINENWSIWFDDLYYYKEILLEGIEKEYKTVYNYYRQENIPNREILTKKDILREYKRITEEKQ